MKKRKVNNYDEYYNDGLFELSRMGKIVSLKNIMTSEMHNQYKKHMLDNYDELKNSIDKQVFEIKQLVSECDPLGILNFAVTINFYNMLNMMSECRYSASQNIQMRALEYIQSILVSTKNTYKGSDEDPSEKYFIILEHIEKLYMSINIFYQSWGFKVQKENQDIDDENIRYIVEAQLASIVRGDRYQIYEIENIRQLILPHDAILKKLFEVSAEEVVQGLSKLQYSLSSAKADAINELCKEFKKSCDTKEIEDIMKTSDINIEKNKKLIEDVLGYYLYDVKTVTEWNDKFIDALSLEINQNKSFWNGEYAGWPIIDLPIQKKPFIKIGDRSYCFDYYSLFDNIYRVIQKTIKEFDESYVTNWSHIQQEASEKMVEDIFKKIFPNGDVYRDNYYPKGKSLKQCNENDILVKYDDILIIGEVKAGSFTYTPAITDFRAHVKSFEALVQKADYQCERTKEYIKNNDKINIYDKQKNLKGTINKADIRKIYSFCITIDNFNEFAAKAEKLSFINLNSGTVVLSADDLRVYSDYFDTPLYFLHYLKQRELATKIKNLDLNDELDHLGLYIKHNVYSIKCKNFKESDMIRFNGYREEIDNYFMSLFTDQISYDKPVQKIPDRVKEILDFIYLNDRDGKTYLAEFILDFATDAKEQLASGIEYAFKRQKEINTTMPIITFGELRYCMFVNQISVPQLSDKYKDDYVDSTIYYKKLDDYVILDLYYDNDEKLVDVQWRIRSLSNIKETQHEYLSELGEKYAHSRAESLKKREAKRKIGRNDLCPCGSGLKYKRCCGK